MLGTSPLFLLFVGSSSVGKTTMLNHLDPIKFKRISLSARTTRQRLGNPSWQSLIDDQLLAIDHQRGMMHDFLAACYEAVEEFRDDLMTNRHGPHYVMERSPWDVLGYSIAFKCGDELIHDQLIECIAFENQLADVMVEAYLVPFKINRSIPYELIDARPPEHIRDAHETELEPMLRHYSKLPQLTHEELLSLNV